MLTITKFYQSAFVISLNDTQKCAFDFGSESEEIVDKVGKVDATFVSHIHPDHFHLQNLLRLNAPIYGPKDMVTALIHEGISANAITIGESVKIGPLTVTAWQSNHGSNISAPIDNLSYEIKASDKKIFFLGDMAVSTVPPSESYDIILTPVGNSKVFSPEQSLSYLEEINHNGLVVPIHYDGRADREAGNKFKLLVGKKYDVRVLEVGQTLTLN